MRSTLLTARLERLVVAEKAVIAVLKELYPIDSEVRCMLMHGQINLSCGRVIGYDGGTYGCVRVRLESRTREVRSVAAENIL